MDRRGFFTALRNSVSSSFILGGVGGAVAGAAGAYAYDRRDNTHFSYAQQGEDLVIENILSQIGIKNPVTYLDVGAFDPVYDSNTYILYKAGGHGVLVEPNPAKTRRLESVRPRDKTLNVGIGTSAQRTTADYYLIGGPSKGAFNSRSKTSTPSSSRSSAPRRTCSPSTPKGWISTFSRRWTSSAFVRTSSASRRRTSGPTLSTWTS
jgi:hypothetical protein